MKGRRIQLFIEDVSIEVASFPLEKEEASQQKVFFFFHRAVAYEMSEIDLL